MAEFRFLLSFLLSLCLLGSCMVAAEENVTAIQWPASKYVSAVGQPGMKNDNLRVAIEAWNQCNEVGEEAPNMGSPRMADCFDIDFSSIPSKFISVDRKKKETHLNLFFARSGFCPTW